jgi:hypothetical protein
MRTIVVGYATAHIQKRTNSICRTRRRRDEVAHHHVFRSCGGAAVMGFALIGLLLS